VLVGLVLGAGSGVALGLQRLSPTLGIGIDPAKLKRMLSFSLPIVPGSVAILLSTYASRFIINDLLSLTDVGLFTWASQLAAIPALLLLGVQSALTPLVMKHHPDPQTKAIIARSFEVIVAVELLLCLGLGMFTPEFIRQLGYSRYSGAGPLVMLLAPAYLMLQLYVFAPGFAVAERTGLQLSVSIVGAISAVVLNYLFVTAAGLAGAAAATLVSSALFIGSWFVLSHRLYPVPVNWLRLGLLIAAAAACAAMATFVTPDGVVRTMLFKALLLFLLAALAASLGFARIWRLKQLIALRPRLRRMSD
jgi:O-antigen/teichoic acid export membrane protein